MACTSNTSNSLDRDGILSLGFQLVTVASNREIYKYQQYTLVWDILTNKVEVYYGNVNTQFSYVYVSIVTSLGELTTMLQRNGVI